MKHIVKLIRCSYNTEDALARIKVSYLQVVGFDSLEDMHQHIKLLGNTKCLIKHEDIERQATCSLKNDV
ncbi:hypothetical protein MUK42_33210 [Musa troglodytarum]|uniref:Uncharacterized protein n=1 Tax=Musa troglodytarum TaxID=320322 RepID=A0A9E7KHZ7_9LILI|nr:hypothetical protein MUK42_33210 [Musa troglodytarum]